jgi:hypothetical protein
LNEQAELDLAMVHETGHALSQRLSGSISVGEVPETNSGWAGWLHAAEQDGRVPSGYAR